MRIAVIMMIKNEPQLLQAFIPYHKALVGAESLYLFDNGSTDPETISLLEAAEKDGTRVNREHDKPQDFINKGEIVAALIQHLDATTPFDFYFPLDCDEFLACQGPQNPELSLEAIRACLEPFRGYPGTLCIRHKYWGNPLLRNRYQISTTSRKCFFAHGSCSWLDHGFHHGRARSSAQDLTTPIVYFELHNRPYRFHIRASREKLLPFHRDLSRRALKIYGEQQFHNYHCALELLQSKSDYLASFTNAAYPIIDTSLLLTLKRLRIPTHGLFEPVPPRGRRLWLAWLKLRGHLHEVWAGLVEPLVGRSRSVRNRLRHRLARILRS